MHVRRNASHVVAGVLAAILIAALLGGCSLRPVTPPASTGDPGSMSYPPSPGSPAGIAQDGAATNGAAAGAAKELSSGTGGQRTSASAPVVAADRLVIRDGTVRLEVTDVPGAVAKLRAMLGRYGAVVSALQMTTDTGGTPIPLTESDPRVKVSPSGLPFSASVTILVPVARLDAFRAEAEKLGRILSESGSDQDVTQEHADLKARLINARAEEARLRTFFDRARSVDDMLSIERELSRVRSDIESMAAQLATMERQAALATLTIELVEPPAVVQPANGVDWGFREAVRGGIQSAVGLVRWLLEAVLALSPVWVLGLALVLVVRWRMRARRARSAASAPSGDTTREPGNERG